LTCAYGPLAVHAANPVRCLAVSLYGPHALGTDLDVNEKAMFARLAYDAAAMYAKLEASKLRGRIKQRNTPPAAGAFSR
jgi:hypothetical protein